MYYYLLAAVAAMRSPPAVKARRLTRIMAASRPARETLRMRCQGFLLPAALSGLLAGCTPPPALPLQGGAQVQFISEDWCAILTPERLGRREVLSLEYPYYVLEGKSEVSLGLQSDHRDLTRFLRFHVGGRLLFEHRVGMSEHLGLPVCMALDQETGAPGQVECEPDPADPTSDFLRFPLSPAERAALTETYAPDRADRRLEIRTSYIVRRFDIPPEAHAYLLDPDRTCRQLAARTTP